MLERKVLEFIAGAIKDNDIDYMMYIKNKLTNFYLTFLSIVIILPLASSLYRAEDIGWQPIFSLHILSVIIIFLASAFRKHISTKQKAILLISLSYISGLAGFLQFGLFSMGLLFFTIASILSFILFELRFLRIIVTLTVITILLIGIFYPYGVIESNIDLNQLVQSRKLWIVAVLSYSLLLISILSGVGIILYSLYGILDYVKSQKNELLHLNKKLEKLSVTDNLTQALNRKGIDDTINNELKQLERYKHDFGIILLDIDYFKRINDDYGHKTGDAVIVNVVQILKKNIRDSDYIGRWGGEEFLIICAEVKKDDINKVAESLRKHIQQYQFEYVGKVTCSFGTAIANKEDSIDSLLQRADNALYKAKKDGRNRVSAG